MQHSHKSIHQQLTIKRNSSIEEKQTRIQKMKALISQNQQKQILGPQIFAKNFINDLQQDNLPKSSRKNINSQNKILKTVQKQRQSNNDLKQYQLINQLQNKSNSKSSCCVRLFTFMESTQKYKDQEQNNKQNQSMQNLIMNHLVNDQNSKFEHNIKANFNCNNNGLKKINQNSKKLFSHKQEGMTLRSIPSDKNNIKTNKKLMSLADKSNTNMQQDYQNDIISQIESSRKKRQELLIQLQTIDLDHLGQVLSSSSYHKNENINKRSGLFTPSQNNAQSLSFLQNLNKHQSTRNIYSQYNKQDNNDISPKRNFFRKQNKSINLINNNEAKSPRVIMKQNLRQRHFSQINLKNSKTPSSLFMNNKETNNIKFYLASKNKDQMKQFKQTNRPNQKIIITCRKNTEIETSLKKMRRSISNQGCSSNRQNKQYSKDKTIYDVKTDRQSKQKQSQRLKKSLNKSKINISSTLINSKNNNLNKKQNSVDKNQQRKYFQGNRKQNQQQINLQNLMKKKKQLQKQLLTVTDQIVLFNKKRKKK